MPLVETLNRFLGDPAARELKKLWPTVHRIRELVESPTLRSLSLADLPKRTAELRERIQSSASTSKERSARLEAVLPEAFALVCRACELLMGKTVRIIKHDVPWDMVPFDVQLLGAIVLHRGAIAEMKTGEGKTLVCTMPVYLNALTGRGVHVVTVNDYLARRDAQWMGIVYEALGLTVGTIVHGLSGEERKKAYACDVTYGTNNEFGFDYLRDNMTPSLQAMVQRELHYAIVDEVDSILIDEARTPLIISQPAEESTEKYIRYARLVRELQEHVHFSKDEKQRVATLTEEGIRMMEKLLGVENIYTEKGFEEVHHIEQALRAHAIYQRDVDYVVKDGEVIIVDEFTGRLMPGRRYSHGLHQAIEAKEGVEVQRESKTLATITFQNYFRLYEKLAGMTGTAKTEEEEFESIYRLRVYEVPTHKPCVRVDESDAVYRTVAAKFQAVSTITKEKYEKGQPVLIGTTSIEKSEILSVLLQKEGVPHQVLNAKHHEKEADIVAKAGQKGTVTIATNMAGRGTDIKLGEGVANLGGLCVLGTERHEARRIDNQLRGRSGRQGDLGESRFFVSMEDDLMRLFGGDRLKSLMERLNVPDDMPLENRMVSRSIENAQKKVEGRNFDIRKHVLQYDDVMNKHREIIYKRRRRILEKPEEDSRPETLDSRHGTSLHDDILAALHREVERIVLLHAATDDAEQWNAEEIHEALSALHPYLGREYPVVRLRSFLSQQELIVSLMGALQGLYDMQCRAENPRLVAQAERIVTLRAIDTHWMNHIDDMAHLREQVALAGYGQRDPLIEYQDQGFRRFQQLLATIDSTVVRTLLLLDFRQFARVFQMEQEEERVEEAPLETNIDVIEEELQQTGVRSERQEEPHSAEASRGGQERQAPLRGGRKVGRNDPCPCGSGRKFKRCHGRLL